LGAARYNECGTSPLRGSEPVKFLQNHSSGFIPRASPTSCEKLPFGELGPRLDFTQGTKTPPSRGMCSGHFPLLSLPYNSSRKWSRSTLVIYNVPSPFLSSLLEGILPCSESRNINLLFLKPEFIIIVRYFDKVKNS
jgi:hypothetical protein